MTLSCVGLACLMSASFAAAQSAESAPAQTAPAQTASTPASSSASAQAASSSDGASDKTPDEWWRTITFGAAFEGYYQFNANRPPDRRVALRAYDQRANSFSIQQAAIVIDAAPDVSANRRFGVRLDLQFGQATDAVQGNPANEPRAEIYRHVWQAYGTYIFPVGRGLQVDFGKFASNLGYETNYAKDNQAFSRAYLFNFLPFYHSGVRTTYPVNDKVTLMYMLTNGIQQTEDFNDFKSHHVTAIIKPISTVSWTTSSYTGQEQPDGGKPVGPDGRFRVIDSYVTYTPTPVWTLGVDVNRTTNQLESRDPKLSLTGVAGYARYQFTPAAAVGVRYEHLADEGLFGGLDQRLQEITATLEYTFAEGFLVRGEFRRDWSDEDFFPARAVDARKDHQNTALIGLVWWIGNKKGAW